MLPSQEWKLRRFKQKWFAGETISVGIGQGYNAYTPLQLAAGDRDDRQRRRDVPAAHRQLRRGHPHARAHRRSSPSRCARSTSSPSTSRSSSRRWSASTRKAPARAPSPGAGYVSAGKTGTAQVIGMKQGEKYVESRVQERHRDHALFIAYAPADNAEDRARGGRRERRFRRARRRADRAQGARLLPARQAARAGKARQGRRRCIPTIRRLGRFLTRHIDGTLLGIVLALMAVGLLVLFSASNASAARVTAQLVNMLVALGVMWVFANIPPHYLMRLALAALRARRAAARRAWRCSATSSTARGAGSTSASRASSPPSS